MKLFKRIFLALALATVALGSHAQFVAQVDHFGPYLVVAGGANQYDYDCGYGYYSDCRALRTSAGKVALGWRFGRYAVEGWYADFGRGRIPATQNTLGMKAAGVNAAWSIPFSAGTEGLIRAGLVDVSHSRTDDVGTQRLLTGSFGLAMVLHLSNNVAIELAWDATTGEGINTGSAVASAFTAGLRLTF